MELEKFVEKYSKNFILCEDKTLKDLEDYGFTPKYDVNTGELISETLWVNGGIFGNRPVMEMSSRDMEINNYEKEKATIFNPLRKFVMNFYDWFRNQRYVEDNKILNMKIYHIDITYFNVVITLIEDGVIKREK